MNIWLGGNVTTTTLALICLNEVLTYDAPCLQALTDGKAVKLFLNVVEADFLCVRRSQFAALRCLNKLSGCRVLQKDIMSLRAVYLLFSCLNYNDYELMLDAIRMISDISTDSSTWEAARLCGGIQKLINLLDSHQNKIICTTQTNKSELLKLRLSVTQYAAKALSILYKDEENRKITSVGNIINISQFWIRSKHQHVTIPILILLQHLSFSMSFRKQVNESNMMFDVLHHLRSPTEELKQAAADLILICADDQGTFEYFYELLIGSHCLYKYQHTHKTLFFHYYELRTIGHIYIFHVSHRVLMTKCADDQGTFECFYKPEFITEVFQILSSNHINEALMISISGIIWKCSKTQVYLQQFETLNVTPVLTQLLQNQPVQVKAYVAGIIGMCIKSPILREAIKKSDGIDLMVNYLQTTYVPLIINLNEALARGSEDPEILVQYLQLDAVQLIWSCLKNSDVKVQSSAASALCIILKNMKIANLQMENSLDGIECIIDLLISKRKELLIPACTLIHNLAKDKDALSVLVEFNVASHLMRLMKTNDKKLLQQLCLAIASCCSFKKGCEKFADCGITLPLLKHLKAKNKSLRITAASALARIASLPNWCPIESQNKIIPVLTEMLLDVKNKTGNESAAVILRHILCNTDCNMKSNVTDSNM